MMTVIASATMFYSCETMELEDLTDPNALSPDLADADLLLNTIQVNYLSAMQDMQYNGCLLYTSPSPRDGLLSRMPSSA